MLVRPAGSRRRPVAMLGPLPGEDDVLDYLRGGDPGEGDLLDLARPRPVPAGAPSSDEIFEYLGADQF